MTNKEILFCHILAARNAETILNNLLERITDIFGSHIPLAKDIEEAYQSLDFSQILYALGYNEIDYVKPDGPDPQPFIDWLNDDRELGYCSDCANCRPTDNPEQYGDFTRCAVHGGYCVPSYGCHDFKPKDSEQ